ncbi:MAG: amidohydrolase family protein [Alphaproteobacteria bacterium]|nr:amidohydrolase family protein [Alphaproteobacteria bacterium]
MSDAQPRLGNSLKPPNPAWLAKVSEPALEPDLPIVDPHHHLWERGDMIYMYRDLLEDLQAGHNIVSTVFIDCRSMYRKEGPTEMRPLGETEFVNGVAAMFASGSYGASRACAGIVSYADLRLGAKAREVLEAQVAAGNGRFRGIRYATGWDKHGEIRPTHTNPPQGLMADKTWREGFAQLGKLGLTFDAWLYHPQLGELAELAGAFPDIAIILDHVGGPLGYGPYGSRHKEEFAAWKASMATLARHANVTVKVGGLGMPMGWFDFYDRPAPPTSQMLADAFKPWVETCIELFGAERCMFESNFPVDKITSSYSVLWNAFKRLAAKASAAEKKALFSGTAARVYKLALA